MEMANGYDMNSLGFNIVDYPVGEAVHKAPSCSSHMFRPSPGMLTMRLIVLSNS